MYVYIYIHIYINTYTYIYIYIYIYIYGYIYIYIYIYGIQVYVYIHMLYMIYTYIYIFMYTHIYIYIARPPNMNHLQLMVPILWFHPTNRGVRLFNNGRWDNPPHIYIYIFLVNYNDLTAISLESWLVSKGNHPQMAARFRLVKYDNLPSHISYIISKCIQHP